MYKREIAQLTFLALFIFSASCEKKVDYKKNFEKLQAQNKKEVANLKAKHKARLTHYEQKLSLLAAKIDELRERLSVTETRMETGLSHEVPKTEGRKGVKGKIVQPVKQPEAPIDTEGLTQYTPEGMDDALKWLMENYETSIEEDQREQYRKDFGDYIARLREQSVKLPVLKRKEKLLQNLQEKIDNATDDEEIELLENRMEKVKNAKEGELEGVLDYYQKLDNIQGMNEIMSEYGISREDLREFGIEPPPRSSWRPDVTEVVYNLRNFVENYEPLAGEEQREHYRKDFGDYINELTTRPTVEEAIQRRDEMLIDLQERYKTASENEKRRLDRRMLRLEDTDVDRLRRTMQFEKFRGLDDLAAKYDIPRSELSYSGVLIPRRRRFR